MNWADLYSNSPAVGAPVQQIATAPGGPNQSIVTGSGQMSGMAASAAPAAFSWLALGAGLVLLRVLISMGGRVG